MTSSLPLELGGIIVALALLARLAGKVGFSPIPLYLFAGLALGSGGFFPVVTAEEFIEVGAGIGILLLLFTLGLEYSARELTENLKVSLGSGFIDLALNFPPGFIAGLMLDMGVTAALLLGGITYMSSSGVIAKLLGDLGWVGNRETPVVLSVLVIEDLLMAAYLPLMVVLLRGGSVETIGLSMGIAIVAVLLVVTTALRWGDSLSRIVFSRSDEVLLLSILGIILVVAGAAELLGISAAVGAFLVGIGLSGPAAERARDLLTPLRDLFAAVFFFFFGLEIDPQTIPPVLGTVAVLALVTALTKMGGGWWIAGGRAVARRGRIRAGAALIARGEFSIAIAGIGLASGLGEAFGALAAGYVMAMAILGPVIAHVVATAMSPRMGSAEPA